jgi:hypothetical protein
MRIWCRAVIAWQESPVCIAALAAIADAPSAVYA